MESRTLQYVAEACQGELKVATPDRTVSRICTDSRQAQSGDLFFALSGERFDAHEFLPQVVEHGVAAIVAERSKVGRVAPRAPFPSIIVDNTRKALGRLAAHYRHDF